MMHYYHPMQSPVRRSFDVEQRNVEVQAVESLEFRLKSLATEADILRETAQCNDVYDALGSIIDGIGDTVGKIKLLSDSEYEGECQATIAEAERDFDS